MVSLVAGTTAAAGMTLMPVAASAADDGLLVAQDRFDASTSSGWGAATLGGSYVHTGSDSYSQGGGYGTVTLTEGGQQREAMLPEVKTLDGVARIDIAMDEIPSEGGGVYHSVHLRQVGSTSYRATLRVTPDGRGHLYLARVDAEGTLHDLGYHALTEPVRPHGWLTMEFSATGTSPVSLKTRVFDRQAQPPAWQLESTDSSSARLGRPGAVSLQTYASSSGPGTTAFYDSLDVRSAGLAERPGPSPVPLPPPPAPAPIVPGPGPVEPTPPPADPPSADLGSTGALPLGQASYPIPSNAVFVSPQGSDSATGSQSQPLRTVEAALQRAATGGTIVLRGGSYHQRFSINDRVTIQNFPGEAVWFDGSTAVQGYTRDAQTWRHDGWSASFDNSPSYTPGDRSGGFLNPDYPMAAHPDQVWIDGVAQRQVSSKGAVSAGTFYVDYASDRLYLGSDPTGKSVRASAIGRAIEVRAPGSVLRGFGVRRFAPSVPDMGAVTVERPDVTVENLHLVDNSTTGVSLLAQDITARQLTVLRNGLLGIHGNHSDRLVMEHIVSSGNNVERFNQAPVSGGIKITRARDVSLDRATLTDNAGPGFWLDESVFDGSITNSLVHDNAGHGISLEISATMMVAGNVIRDNGRFGVKVNNTSDVALWNNTVVRNDRPLNIVQDDRRGDDPGTPGHDPRRPFPDPTMPWVNGPVTIRNNVLSAASGNCLLCVEDYSGEYSAEQLGVSANNNVYQRTSSSAPQFTVIWSRGAGNPSVFADLQAFKAASGQEARSLQLVGTAAADADGRTTSAVRQVTDTVSVALPASIAQRLGLDAGARVLGAPLD
ncbi:right-handed parallel beta-helix repeat-containing protein [uncultured Serinicoccus sp.]|uniref:right-handed parallel beta-helix repeat-containing protein n=1 Tax=uncultured Serinicoccus sp. TaxID=735514 RepID=UPI002605584C|nr:right-handed parallel beta-helix repeat-containing protein [uncultured Serinicoccus sp.]